MDGSTTDRQRRDTRTHGVRARGSFASLMTTAAVALLAWAVSACGAGTDAGAERARETGFHGVLLEPPEPRPDFTLADTDGRPFRFRQETAGQLTLLFFGYTNCPDICPVHMANLSAVLERFAHDVRSRVRVVFVTTDPARDSAVALRKWLDNFDPAFVGLTGTQAEVDEAQRLAGVPVAAREEPAEAADGYAVAHASQIIAYSPDDRAYVAYPAGIRQIDWARDLPRLLEPDRYLQHGGQP